jgi:hypothetical protein
MYYSGDRRNPSSKVKRPECKTREQLKPSLSLTFEESYNFAMPEDLICLDRRITRIGMVKTLNKPSSLMHEIQLEKVGD